MAKRTHINWPKDPKERMMYDAWKASYYYGLNKGRDYRITFEEFKELWKDKWHLRGRCSGNYCLSVKDFTKPWDVNNVQVVEVTNKTRHAKRGLTHRKYKDPIRHNQYTAFMRMRAQAKYRQEPFELSFEDFYTLWDSKWSQRGRGVDSYCMSRKDPKLPWNKDNTHVITRLQQLRETDRGSGPTQLSLNL